MWPFKRTETRSLTESPWRDTGDGPPVMRSVSAEKALTLVPVFAAARLLADSVASLPLKLYTRNPKGLQVELPTPSLLKQPAQHGTLFDWLFRMTESMALAGDAIGVISARDYYGWPTAVELLNPREVQTIDTNYSGPGSYMEPIWLWRGRRLDPNDIFHVPWFCTPYRVRGLSPLGAYAATVNVGLGAQDFGAAYFNNGGQPPGHFRNTEQKVDKEDAAEISNRLTSRLRTRQPLVYGRDWEYSPISVNPAEAQFVQTLQMTATQIAAIYGIPPENIGGQTGGSLTYNSVEQRSLGYITFSLRPWLVRAEQAITQLFPRGQYVLFDPDDMIRTDTKTRAEIDALSLGFRQPGWKDQTEVRQSRNLPPMKPPPPPLPAPPALLGPAPAAGAAIPAKNGAAAPSPTNGAAV
jgi:HK97 family phage portal protein